MSHSVVNRYNLNNIKGEDTNNILDKHINDYEKKFVRFKFSCKISSITIRDYLKHILIGKYRFRPSDTINMQITFVTKLDNMTNKHYLQQPRQAIENNLIKKTNRNPNLIILFNSFSQPDFRFTLMKYWRVHHDINGRDCFFYPYEWVNFEPNLHPIDVINHA